MDSKDNPELDNSIWNNYASNGQKVDNKVYAHNLMTIGNPKSRVHLKGAKMMSRTQLMNSKFLLTQ